MNPILGDSTLHPEVQDLSTSETDESKSGDRELKENLHSVHDPRNLQHVALFLHDLPFWYYAGRKSKWAPKI